MAAESATPPVPMRFLIVVFAAAIIVGALIAYFGFGGQLGGPIP
jgi:hypothetical protein